MNCETSKSWLSATLLSPSQQIAVSNLERQPGRDTCFGDARTCGKPKALETLPWLLAESLALQHRFEGQRPVQRGQWQGKRHVLPGPQMETKRSRCTLVRFPGEGTWEGTGGGSLDRSEGYKAKFQKNPCEGVAPKRR